MKDSIVISLFLIFAISCNNVDNSQYIVNKWQLTEIKLENKFDANIFLDKWRYRKAKSNPGLTDEQLEQAVWKMYNVMLKDVENGNWRKNIEKESIAFTANGEYLDYNSNNIGNYNLSLDGKRLMMKKGYDATDTFEVIHLSKKDLEISYYGIIKTYKVMN